MCIDPITMRPEQLIFQHWHLTEQYSNVLDNIQAVSHQGADVITIRSLDAQLDELENHINHTETFLRIAGLTDMEIYQ